MFVSVNPTYDTPERLTKYRDDLFGPELIVLRETSEDAPNFKNILRQFKVPVGLNEAEKAQINKLFMTEAEKQKEASWYYKLTSLMDSKSQLPEINEFE